MQQHIENYRVVCMCYDCVSQIDVSPKAKVLGRCVPWTMRPLDEASLPMCSWQMCADH
jgi:hypothetical protein